MTRLESYKISYRDFSKQWVSQFCHFKYQIWVSQATVLSLFCDIRTTGGWTSYFGYIAPLYQGL